MIGSIKAKIYAATGFDTGLIRPTRTNLGIDHLDLTILNAQIERMSIRSTITR